MGARIDWRQHLRLGAEHIGARHREIVGQGHGGRYGAVVVDVGDVIRELVLHPTGGAPVVVLRL